MAAAAVLALTGCAGGTGTASSPAATSNGVADLPADQILAKANAAAKAQQSVHVAGQGASGGQTFGLDMKLSKGSGGVGTLTIGSTTLQVVYAGGDIYLKGDKYLCSSFW
jgi:hypothetical protein